MKRPNIISNWREIILTANLWKKASEQLGVIGALVPEADPIKKTLAPPARPSLTSKILMEVIGSPDLTVSRDGVLISRDDKAQDLLAAALERGGVLPAEYLTNPSRTNPNRVGPAPVMAPANRTPPARNNNTTTTAPPAPEKDGSGITIQPTRPGALRERTPGVSQPQTAPATTRAAAADGSFRRRYAVEHVSSLAPSLTFKRLDPNRRKRERGQAG
ncbi:MAG: hypothetical protein WKF84_04600 [Pyrinomonadaceae bacterium]